MTAPLFLDPGLADPLPAVGAEVDLGGEEGRHAAVVRRIGPGEVVLVSGARWWSLSCTTGCCPPDGAPARLP